MGSHAPVPPSAEPTVTYSSGRLDSLDSTTTTVGPPDFRLLHFNDVYHLDASSAEPVGGISRFMTAVNEYRNHERYQGPELVTLFSGDVFNPSLESSVTKGSHMVPILNKIGTQCACVGNHDLDFGVQQFRHLTSKCAFPWLLANVLDPALGDNVPIGNAGLTHMITTSNGLKIGLLGLGEREWLETINALPPNLIYRSATDVAKELVPQLRAQGADLIVALTHMREPNDHKLARQMAPGEIDIILGGHDHFYAHSLINGTHVLRSGSDFKNLSYLEVRRRRPASPGDPAQGQQPKWDVDIWRRDIYSSIACDPATDQLVDKLTSKLKKSLEKPIGFTAAPLDARFTTVRLRESNIGNFVCDIMRLHYHADMAIMAAGTIRGDQIYPPGPIRVKDVTDCFPFEDPVVVIKVKGSAVWQALENGVSLYPALEGRFPQVSNIKFTFDPQRPPGKRVTSVHVVGVGENNGPIDLDRVYTMATRGYMARGKDGYSSLLVQSEGGECEEIVSEENGILISMLLRQYFMALKALDKWAFWGAEGDRH
ncbi:Metallo-dependent phosphatase-like protein, partial [Pseudoneurospora amorphoporcata]